MTSGGGVAARANTLRIEVERLPSLRQAADDSDAVTTRAEQLEELAAELRVQTGWLQLFRSRGLDPQLPPERPPTLLKMTRSYRARFEEDRASIADDPEDSTFKWRYREDLGRLVRSIERALDEAWRLHVTSLIPPGLDQQLDLLGGTGVLSEQIARMRELGANIEAEQLRIPSGAEGFERVESAARELRELWQDLRGIPEDVRAFLAAASTGHGAPLGDLTPTVRTWLEDSELIDSLRLIMKGGA